MRHLRRQPTRVGRPLEEAEEAEEGVGGGSAHVWLLGLCYHFISHYVPTYLLLMPTHTLKHGEEGPEKRGGKEGLDTQVQWNQIWARGSACVRKREKVNWELINMRRGWARVVAAETFKLALL